ncbi:aldo/keto reductase [Haloplanus pelagicus]|jgi:2,5-diketo-D-gluconate reductase B|uniref:aldo/keto reductase n=1 Tax=Haloplanus pelagicus TaxID=2949995 RepID=UPI00203AFBF5|nr:aldo/keto reductase [Haloplanus sp. HW8-1]
MPAEELPTPGLGTLRNIDADQCARTVARAVEVGYRHIDTAQKYDNESLVGDGLDRAAVPRDDLFVATKIAESNLGYDDVLETADRSLERLGLDTVDLLYIHWPASSGETDRYDPEETIPAFNELFDDGAFRHFGVANFSVELIEEIDDRVEAPIFANQVEMHPLLQQAELAEYAQANDMYLVAYSPLLRGDLGRVPELTEIAAKHDATPAQVSLAWLMSKDNVVPIPKGRGDHLVENFRARDLELTPEDIETIENIDREFRIVDRPKGPWQW